MSALKQWKSQEVASYSPAVVFFFFFHADVLFRDDCDYHSCRFTRTCVFVVFFSFDSVVNIKHGNTDDSPSASEIYIKDKNMT